jgi:hypothetical protein
MTRFSHMVKSGRRGSLRDAHFFDVSILCIVGFAMDIDLSAPVLDLSAVDLDLSAMDIDLSAPDLDSSATNLHQFASIYKIDPY